MSIGLEGTPSGYSGAPPDRAVRTVDEVADELWSIVTRDGGLDDHEMQVLGALFQALSMLGQQQAQAQAQGQPMGGGAPAQGGSQPYGTTPGTSPVTATQDYGGGGF